MALTIETRLEGARAEEYRLWLGDVTAAQLEEHGLARYRPTGGSIEALEPIGLEDDRIRNVFEVRERYILNGAWFETASGPLLELNPPMLLHALPNSDPRTTPLALPQGLHEQTTIEIDAPAAWPLETPATRISNPWFDFELTSRSGLPSALERQRISLDYQLTVHGPELPAERLSDYQKAVDTSWHWLGYSILLPAKGEGRSPLARPHPTPDEAHPSPGTKLPNWLMVVLITGVLGSMGLLLYRRKTISSDGGQT